MFVTDVPTTQYETEHRCNVLLEYYKYFFNEDQF